MPKKIHETLEEKKAPEYEILRELQNSAKPLTQEEKKKINVSYFLRKIGF